MKHFKLLNKSLLLIIFLLSFVAHADVPNFVVGERVYRGSIYPSGGVVMYLDDEKEKAYLRVTIHPNRQVIVEEDYINLSVARGCLNEFCVGDKVYLGPEFKSGLTVKAINNQAQVVLISGELLDGRSYLFEHEQSEIKKL